MKRQSVFAILMASLLFLLFFLITEHKFSFWHVLYGFPATCLLSLGIITQIHERKSPAWLFILSFVTLFYVYVLIKWFKATDTYVSMLIGVFFSAMIYYGWIHSYKPFSREDYIERQRKPAAQDK